MLPAMGSLFTPEAIWGAVRRVELAAVAARASLGQISEADELVVMAGTPVVTRAIVREISARERVTDHDVAAFVDVMQKHIADPAARWFHFGLTSADVTDTALSLRLCAAADLIIGEASTLLAELCGMARNYRMVLTAGRTHGQHAEIITFGVRLANWAFMVERALRSLEAARSEMTVGKLSGACGTYTNIDPRVEAEVCRTLGLMPITATQVIPRDLHANLVSACVRLGNAIGQITFNLRIMASTEYGEVEEGRRPGQKGSSAMPHKHNPIRCEQLDGLARPLRGYLVSSLEDVELLFERDISHSGPERIVLPDALILTHYMAVTMTTVLRRLVVHEDVMAENVKRSLGLMFSATVLSELVADGTQRDDAYRRVQALAEAAVAQRRSLRYMLEEADDLALTPAQLDAMFDTGRFTAHVDEIISRLPMLKLSSRGKAQALPRLDPVPGYEVYRFML